MNYKSLPIIFIFSFFTHFLFAATCNWTGASDNDWTNPNNWSCGIVPSADDDVIIDDAMVELNQMTSVTSLTMKPNSTLKGIGTLDISGPFNIESGFDCTIEIDINSNGLATIGEIKLFIKNSTLQFYGGGSIANNAFLMLNDSGVFKIPSGAEFTVLGKLTLIGIVELPTFVVEGTLNKLGNGVMDFEAYYLFENATVNILEGSIVNFLANGMVCKSINSTINISQGGRLQFARAAQIQNTAISGNGSISVIAPGTPSFNSGTTILDTKINIWGGILFLEDGMTVPSVNQKGGQFSGDDIIVSGNYTWEGGVPFGKKTIQGLTEITDITATSETRNCSGCKLFVEGGGTCETNDFIFGFITVPEDATFTVNAEEDCIIEEIKVEGTLLKTGDATLTLNSFFQFNPQGRISAKGTLKSSFGVNGGKLEPGPTFSSLVMDFPNFILNNDSDLEFQMFELNGNLFIDDMQFTGDLKLNGNLTVSEAQQLSNGDYTIISTLGGTITDTFTTVALPNEFSILYTDTSVILRKEMALVDNDNDGFFSDVDCDDNDPNVNPNAMETPYNGIDDDCDALTFDDDLDQDGFLLADDCDDNDPNINPSAIEIPNNGIDEDCDGNDLMVSLKNLESLSINVFPNPVQDELVVQFENSQQYIYKIIDLHGREWMIGKFENKMNSLNIENLPVGVFILTLKNEEDRINLRLLKTH